MSDSELSDTIYAEIKRLAAIADELAAKRNYTGAIAEYNKAWQMIPEPKNEWEAATWLLAAIGDACFLSRHFKSAKDALQFAMTCPGAIGNPFLHLRFGQVYFELGELDSAADELMRAYMGDGCRIFEREDVKYFDFLRTRAKL
jgi:tetratricopeptide (TPR) repeat protein